MQPALVDWVHCALVDCVPFRAWFCKQSLAWLCRTGLPPKRFYAGLAGRFVYGFVSNILGGRARRGCRRHGFMPAWRAVSCVVLWAISCVFLRAGGPPTWLCRPGVPFREWFWQQSFVLSSGRGGRQLGYAGLACRFVCGFVRNLLRFSSGGGGRQLGYARLAPFRGRCCEHSLTFSSRRGARQLVYAGQAGRFVSGFVSNLFSRGVVPGAFLVRQGTRDYVHRGRATRCTGDAGLGALGAR